MASSISQLRFPPLSSSSNRQFSTPLINKFPSSNSNSISFPQNNNNNNNLNLRLNSPSNQLNHLSFSATTGGDGGIIGGGNTGNGGGGWSSGNNGDSSSNDDNNNSSFWEKLGLIGIFIKGWKSRVAADPQFPFKVLMEELVGVTSCVLGDMASRPNFGLNELDFVFSTLVVGSILNFTLMYLLAPTAASAASSLPSIFAGCPNSHMFEPGSFGLLARCGTFVYKGALFATVGFAAGLIGTALSNGLIAVRKKMDPEFETPNKAPPTMLNAVTWALHMGLSSNFRYQTLNGVEFLLHNAASPVVFKSSVVVLRCLNNILGGMSFVVLARLTGAQSVTPKVSVTNDDGVGAAVSMINNEDDKEKEKEKLVVN